MCMPCVRVSGTKPPPLSKTQAVGHSHDEECLVDCGKDSPGKISTFHLSDYSLEDIQAAVNALRISEMPEKLARFYKWEEYV